MSMLFVGVRSRSLPDLPTLSLWLISYCCVILPTSFLIVKPADAVLQSQRHLESNKPTPCVHGEYINGQCICPPGTTGPLCEHCFGRVRLNSTSSSFSDGKRNYTAMSRCTWIIENSESTSGPLLLKANQFLTECCWDHVYVYDGNSVDNNLMAVLSGSHQNREISVPSGQAVVHFISDIAYNLEGFDFSYSWDACPKDCSRRGNCTHGTCQCEDGFTGTACEHRICTADASAAPCAHGVCQGGVCRCGGNFHGDYCQTLATTAVWDTVMTDGNLVARASHAFTMKEGSAIGYIFGGYYFSQKSKQDLLSYNFDRKRFSSVQSVNTPPSSRYDHSMVYYKDQIFVFGGVINNRVITNELWMFDVKSSKWTRLPSQCNDPDSYPKAVAGHTAHIFNDEMHVFFGYNPHEGFLHRVQIYSFVTKCWRLGKEQVSVVGRFGHSSSLYLPPGAKSPLLYVYGGYNQAAQEAAYHISNELLEYDFENEKWTQLETFGLHLHRHSSVIMDGQLIIYGGNDHNESTAARQNECYSSKLVAYDLVCKKWIEISADDSNAEVKRYGHVAVGYNQEMFVFGGFDGVLKDDIVKLTMPDCNTAATTAEECMDNPEARCIFLNKTCLKQRSDASYRQPFLSIIKDTGSRASLQHCPGTSNQLVLQCSEHKDCQMCFMQKNCGWCDSTATCVNSDTVCADGSAITSEFKNCPSKSRSLADAQGEKRPCSLALNCQSCRQLEHCSWFTINSKTSICISQIQAEAEAEKQNRLNSERIASLAHSVEPTRSITALRYLHTFENASATCPQACSEHVDCSNCTMANCMWCSSTLRCVNLETYMISFPYGQCQSWITQANANNNHVCQQDAYDCKSQKTCEECQQSGLQCGWCDDGTGRGSGTCMRGSLKGPFNGTCSNSSWYFTNLPPCNCNGHSSCAKNVAKLEKCKRCEDNTSGEQCERCADGYFGDPRNNGTCERCHCHDTEFCDNETGDCFCTTKGATGPQCDKCDNKYDGDPKQNEECSYKLAIDFIFTFKLDNNEDRDKYVNKINFYAVPFKKDTDVQFSITCDGEEGTQVNVSVTANPISGNQHNVDRRLRTNIDCNPSGFKRTYHASEFAFGTEANTTFHVAVFNFTTPIKIQISFAQSPPINWVLFFVIFSACFVVLLVIAGLVWVIKQRVERYHHMQTRHVEIERMASRPFASVQLDLSPHRYDSATPISIEPCSSYQAGIYTLIVRLPTGGKSYTPNGTSGLAVASSLCSLTQSQLALLQPPDADSAQPNQKSTLRRFISLKNPFASSS